ncbi:M23 family metallopeptidase [Spirulina sp. CS-785/01]|uniref:LysM peptidoglycan-binding domain-containing M23 family metallopeptidase n=1 Tax=Spirulina sp. CS-785/01 TaxID=3021716 RepID=UPI00232F41A8|nr:M23 family metallopeptidase [Spirulina sp. CS-785/01]MDB9314561.1 M23 family metallopeptidase [Spirulina sp. CS-785/01]
MKNYFISSLLSLWGGLLLAQSPLSPTLAQTENVCDSPVLSRLQTHQVQPGETLDSIAAQYGLLPAILRDFNPTLPGVGGTLTIPPMNGIQITVPEDATWETLAETYGVRADVLFELNGCQAPQNQAFIPGVRWQKDPLSVHDYTGLQGYPLATEAEIALPYGWYQNPVTNARTFHSGLDLLASVGTPVLAADGGTVTFVGEQGNYGNLIIITHPQGQQTRYAHLETIQVRVGQTLTVGQEIGRVGTTGKPDITTPHLHFEVRQQFPIGWVAQDPEIHFSRDSGGSVSDLLP